MVRRQELQAVYDGQADQKDKGRHRQHQPADAELRLEAHGRTRIEPIFFFCVSSCCPELVVSSVRNEVLALCRQREDGTLRREGEEEKMMIGEESGGAAGSRESADPGVGAGLRAQRYQSRWYGPGGIGHGLPIERVTWAPTTAIRQDGTSYIGKGKRNGAGASKTTIEKDAKAVDDEIGLAEQPAYQSASSPDSSDRRPSRPEPPALGRKTLSDASHIRRPEVQPHHLLLRRLSET